MTHKESILDAFHRSGGPMELTISNGYKVLIDREDYDLVKGFKWWAGSGGHGHTIYACAHGPNRSRIKMHRLIMEAKKGQIVDHLNGCGLDNRKENLRFCSHSQNLANMHRMVMGSSRFKGVSWDKVKQKWYAKITVNYKQISLGRYKVEEDAARAYDVAAKNNFGVHACLNLN
jgi:hypothetical protein